MDEKPDSVIGSPSDTLGESSTQPQKNLFGIGPASGGVVETGRDALQLAMFAHLSTFSGYIVPFGNIIAPIVFWQIKKDTMPYVVDQAKEALNFQISVLIYGVVIGVAACILIGFALIPLIFIFDIVFTIIAALKANEGIQYRYPLTFRFVG